MVQAPVCTIPVSRESTSSVRSKMYLAPAKGAFMVIGTVTTRLPAVFATVAPAVLTEQALLFRAVDCVPGATGSRNCTLPKRAPGKPGWSGGRRDRHGADGAPGNCDPANPVRGDD